MDIIINGTYPAEALNQIARNALGSATSGISIGGGRSRIHLVNASPSNQDTANAILNNFGELIVSADKTTMNEGDADPIITCSDPAISGDSDLGYLVMLDGVEYDAGTDTVIGGSVSLTLVSPVAGVYEIFLYRHTGTYASGSVTITVNEV